MLAITPVLYSYEQGDGKQKCYNERNYKGSYWIMDNSNFRSHELFSSKGSYAGAF